MNVRAVCWQVGELAMLRF